MIAFGGTSRRGTSFPGGSWAKGVLNEDPLQEGSSRGILRQLPMIIFGAEPALF